MVALLVLAAIYRYLLDVRLVWCGVWSGAAVITRLFSIGCRLIHRPVPGLFHCRLRVRRDLRPDRRAVLGLLLGADDAEISEVSWTSPVKAECEVH